MSLKSINPSTLELNEEIQEHTRIEVEKIVAESHNDFLSWKGTTFKEREVFMKNASRILIKRKKELARLMTIEMGKPVSQSVAEVEKCAWVCDYYAENAESILAEEVIDTDASESYVRFDPIGVVLAVMPWNFPFWQVFRFAAPALMAGNVVVLKHASNVPLCAIEIEKIFRQSGFPHNIFKTLLIKSDKVEDVVKNKLVKAATLTGSEIAGISIASSCGRQLKKCVLELGGSDPFIILEDANLEEAVTIAVLARIINNGQSCIAAKRFIVIGSIYNSFLELFKEKMSQLVIGDPMNKDTQLGPLAREDLVDELNNQVQKSIESGAELFLGGRPINRNGYFYEPTILTNVAKGMIAYNEELFGPVASVIKVKDENEAIEIANDSNFGLGASLWTSDLQKAKRMAAKIETGSVFINGMVKSDPRLPFGGIKQSGYGRELSHYGIKEFVNIKTVWIK